MKSMKLIAIAVLLTLSIIILLQPSYQVVTSGEYMEARDRVSMLYSDTEFYASKMEQLDAKYTYIGDAKYIKERAISIQGGVFLVGTIVYGIHVLEQMKSKEEK